MVCRSPIVWGVRCEVEAERRNAMKAVANIPNKGRGVIATTHIKKGTLVELSDVIEVRERDLLGSILVNYIYEFGEDHCIALGTGSLYNHDIHSNLWFKLLISKRQIAFYSRRNIKKGEELTIDYGYDVVGAL